MNVCRFKVAEYNFIGIQVFVNVIGKICTSAGPK